ncbi:6141_t:CDS:2, partial [Scutellospora calospora]
HSHSKAQYVNGVLGFLIIHDPKDLYIKDYDEEIIVILQNFYHTDSKILLAKFLTPESQGNEPIPDNSSDYVNNAPLAQFKFVQGKKYIIRIINTSAFSKFIFSIDDHPMEVIEVEGMITKKYTVHHLPINIAQQTACFAIPPDKLNPLIKAIVSYDGSNNEDPTSTAWTDNTENCVDLNTSDLKPYKLQKIPDADCKFNIIVDFHPDEKNITLAFINNSTYVIDEKYPTLYKMYDGVTKFATNQNIFLVDHNKVVDIILI